MDIVIETGRLILREFTELDANLIYELNQHPDVTKYTHDSGQRSYASFRSTYKDDHSSICVVSSWRMAVHLKPTLKFLGGVVQNIALN